MKEIKRVDVLSVTKVFLILGLLNGLLLYLVNLFALRNQGFIFNLKDLILFILMQGGMWLFVALIFALLYNLVAKYVGGVKLEW